MKTELPLLMVVIALGLVCSLVPGATPKKPYSGLTAHSRPSSPTRIQAMSSPRVSTFQPGMVGASIARLVLPQALGNAAAMYFVTPCGAGQLEDQHVLGQPALVAGHHAGDAQGVALLAEQRVAAVPGAEGPDRPLLGELHDVLGVVARPGTSAWPSSSGMPTECRAGTKAAGVELLHPAQHVGAHPGHHAHRDGDVRRVGDLDAEHRLLGLEVAHHERDDVHRAALHAAVVEPAHEGLHLVGSIQLLVGPQSFSSTEQM